MSKKKASGSVSNKSSNNSKNLGLKKSHGQFVLGGNILIRQHGTKYYPGKNTVLGKDYTINATTNGIMQFTDQRVGNKYRKYVNIIPSDDISKYKTPINRLRLRMYKSKRTKLKRIKSKI